MCGVIWDTERTTYTWKQLRNVWRGFLEWRGQRTENNYYVIKWHLVNAKSVVYLRRNSLV